MISATLGMIVDYRKAEKKINISKLAANEISEVTISSLLCLPALQSVPNTSM